MAKKTIGNSKSSPAAAPKGAAKPAAKPAPVSTGVRNTARPPKVAGVPAQAVVARVEVTQDMIARRAYEIWLSTGGAAVENWCQAERELRGT
jgi:hypothetical protein